MMNRYSLLLCAGLLLFFSAPVFAQELAPRYGVAALIGSSYDPEKIGLALIQGQVQVPYGQMFWHDAPEDLYLKAELNLGLTLDGRQRALVAVNMMAIYYLPAFSIQAWTPYMEGGIGVIYTDFKVKDQGLRFNFNPQMGVGLERALPRQRALSVGVRLHHLSNGHLYNKNRGINSALLMVGLHF